MATYAIGDIHGHDGALEQLIEFIHPSEDDLVVQLGDVVDRGPNVRRCVDLLIGLADDCEVIVIQGNHEEMMFDALDGREMRFWLMCGGYETLESYDNSRENIPVEHFEFFRSMCFGFEGDHDLFVHAAIDPNQPLDVQSDVDLRWSKLLGWETPHISGKRIICGHTAQRSGLPLVWDGWVCIDTKVYETGWLTALCCEHDTVYQANEFGETRVFPLAEGNSPRR